MEDEKTVISLLIHPDGTIERYFSKQELIEMVDAAQASK